MGVEFTTVTVAENGRVSLPVRQRREIGLERGGIAIVHVENGELRIRSVRSVITEIQEWAKPYRAPHGDHVDVLIAERREEAGRDDGPAVS